MCGAVYVEMVQPRDWRRMPMLKMRAKVLSMDAQGHILLPCEFEDMGYRAALRKQARTLLQRMMDDPLYPTLSEMVPALTNGTTVVRHAPVLPQLRAAEDGPLALCG